MALRRELALTHGEGPRRGGPGSELQPNCCLCPVTSSLSLSLLTTKQQFLHYPALGVHVNPSKD